MRRLTCLAPMMRVSDIPRALFQVAPLFLIAACATPGPVGVRVETVERVVETQRPCPGEKPARPAPLDRPLPTDAVALAALLAAKLAEWSAPGMYGDQADAIMTRCLTD